MFQIFSSLVALGGLTAWAVCPATPSCPGSLTVCIDVVAPPGAVNINAADLLNRFVLFGPGGDPTLRVQRPGGGVTWTVTAQVTSVTPVSISSNALQIKDQGGTFQDGGALITIHQNNIDCEEFIVEHRLDLADLGDRTSGETLVFIVEYTVTE
ncbi:MAG: hypothetical protein A2Z21_03870 [Candidatus Fraserbacteria bacterium RBG_16_55_9]|uniref:Uncharacterized protein n=1 Tax=Fraserbacteria sp. (strain RBG_16_55_9) TaxID=1817864 RepID=A0A1F5UX73_FRAXR|nr:MAG: hypothetical protein A2Z21_03870 [Candidatus Fraserbacteria bacterium RBG_16_55_9]